MLWHDHSISRRRAYITNNEWLIFELHVSTILTRMRKRDVFEFLVLRRPTGMTGMWHMALVLTKSNHALSPNRSYGVTVLV